MHLVLQMSSYSDIEGKLLCERGTTDVVVTVSEAAATEPSSGSG